MEVYLDNAATTKPLKKVTEAMMETLETFYGNPSSLHRKGLDVERKLKEVRKTLGKEIKARSSEVYFTSGGTEGNNLAILGGLDHLKNKSPRVITLATEHKSVLNPFKELETKGFDVCYAAVNSKGRIDLENFEKLLKKNTALVSISYINNETGAIQPIEKIGRMIRELCPGAKFHVDAVQAFGKIDIDVKGSNIHLLTASAHKIHGPKGVGILYVKEGTLLKPLFWGGAQESSIRPGTENTPGIIGFGVGVKELSNNKREAYGSVLRLKEYFVHRLINEVENIKYLKGEEDESPYILNVSFLGVKSEVLLHSLESKGIYVSSGSACTSTDKSHSHVLKAIGLKDDEIDSAIRFSFNRYTTKEELDYTLDQLITIIKDLRMIMKR